ncbi:MAG: hypothetical protein LQ342_007256 [Letrouitia transgressa]|nr:MAG: hypothetical protein LQ342_007256 [Letrouitia transgressa]
MPKEENVELNTAWVPQLIQDAVSALQDKWGDAKEQEDLKLDEAITQILQAKYGATERFEAVRRFNNPDDDV